MNPQQGEQQGSEPPLQIPPVRQGYGRRPAHRSPPPPVRKRAAAYMAPARAAPRVRQDSLSSLPPPAAQPAKDAWVRYVHVSGDAYWHNAATGDGGAAHGRDGLAAVAPCVNRGPADRRHLPGFEVRGLLLGRAD